MTGEATRQLIESVRRAFDGTGHEVDATDDGFRVHRAREAERGAPGPARWDRSGYEFTVRERSREVTYFAQTTSSGAGSGLGSFSGSWHKSYMLAGSGWDGSWVEPETGSDVPAVVMSVAHELGWTEVTMPSTAKGKLVLTLIAAGSVLACALMVWIWVSM